MFTKKNIAMVFAITQIFFTSFAMEQSSLRSLYQQLLKIQGKNDPAQEDSRIYRACPIEGWYFKSILTDAQKTGLIKQYQLLLMGEKSVFVYSMIQSKCLRLTAYMQNMYGQGDPFKYNDKGNKNDIVIGEYINPLNKKITVTRYSFLDGLLQQLDSTDPLMQENEQFATIKNDARKNLIQAIKDAQEAAAVKKAPPAVFQSQVQLIQEAGSDLIKSNDMKTLEMLNEDLKNVLEKY